MKDIDACKGRGDVPTNDLEDFIRAIFGSTAEDIQEMIDKGYTQDSSVDWYDPSDYTNW